LTQSSLVLSLNRVEFFGGVERVLVNCAQATRSRHFQTLIACPAPGELANEAQRRAVEILPISINRSKATRSPAGWLRLLMALRRGRREVTDIARRRNVRLLHTHHPIGALYAKEAAKTLRLPLLLHVHETLPVHVFYRMVARHVIPFCSAFVCCSERSRQLMLALGAPASRVHVIYNGVDPSFLMPVDTVEELARPGPHVGIFGVLEPRKGQDIFVQAARRVAAQHPAAMFWIVGDLSFAENAGYVDALRASIAAAGLADRIRFTGHRRDVRDWMAGMDVIVLASRDREALPTVLIEGAALGRALVATDVGGVREIIADGSTGLVVPPGDPDALAHAIQRCLGPEGSQFGNAARTDALCRFGFDRFGRQMADLYETLLSQGAH
jgi:glycosyltransferase involved in cell wall biosynthesis